MRLVVGIVYLLTLGFSNSCWAAPTFDYYKALRVSPNATASELKSAYRALAKETHPDLHPNDPQATEKFKAGAESYEVLSDPIKRARYDDSQMGRSHYGESAKPSQAQARWGVDDPFFTGFWEAKAHSSYPPNPDESEFKTALGQFLIDEFEKTDARIQSNLDFLLKQRFKHLTDIRSSYIDIKFKNHFELFNRTSGVFSQVYGDVRRRSPQESVLESLRSTIEIVENEFWPAIKLLFKEDPHAFHRTPEVILNGAKHILAIEHWSEFVASIKTAKEFSEGLDLIFGPAQSHPGDYYSNYRTDRGNWRDAKRLLYRIGLEYFTQRADREQFLELYAVMVSRDYSPEYTGGDFLISSMNRHINAMASQMMFRDRHHVIFALAHKLVADTKAGRQSSLYDLPTLVDLLPRVARDGIGTFKYDEPTDAADDQLSAEKVKNILSEIPRSAIRAQLAPTTGTSLVRTENKNPSSALQSIKLKLRFCGNLLKFALRR
jgi:curved DNA-binding protein CbpA